MFIPPILDIEASGFGSESYPIEIGVVTGEGDRLCCLIKPHREWQHWDESAQNLHGISREMLDTTGRDIRRICLEFNALLEGTTVYSDAWTHDSPWLRTLYEYGCVECKFVLSSIESIVTEEQLEYWDAVKQKIITRRGENYRHRATHDALLIQQTWLETSLLVKNRIKLA